MDANITNDSPQVRVTDKVALQSRESFTFYRSFYEAIKSMPPKVQPELYTAVMEYALFGIEPVNLSEIAYGVFVLIKPTLDVNNARFANGKKGGRRRVPNINVSPLASPPAPSVPLRSKYSASFESEVAQMKQDVAWLEQGVCMKFGISACEAHALLDEYLSHLNSMCADKPHDSYGDAQRHFCSWYRQKELYTKSLCSAENLFESKAYSKNKVEPSDSTPDYGFSGGFGGKDI